MSKLSFRARALDASKPMPIYMAEELPDLPDYSAINRAVPQMPTGMQKEEECEHHLQRAIVAGLIIPTPEVSDIPNKEFYDKVYPANYKQPRQLIHMQPFTMEQDIPDYDMDSDDERWLHSQTQKLELSPFKFEEMMDRLEKSSGQTVVTLNEAKALLKEDDDLIIAVFDYWLNKRLKTQHPLILTVKTEHRAGTAANNPYLAFRRRTEKMQTRKNRKNDEASYEKMLKLRRDLCRAVTLLELVKRREKIKREYVHLTVEVFEKRYQAKDFSGSIMAEASALKASRPAFTPIFHNNSIHNWTNKAVLKDEVIPRREKRQYKKRKHKPLSLHQGRSGGSLSSIGHDLAAASSDEEAIIPQLSPEPEEVEDEGQFAFRRNKFCSYHMPLREEGNWSWHSKEENGMADKRFRFTLTSLSNPRRCVGFARRRVGRGGRIILDRMATDNDDFWRTLDFSITETDIKKHPTAHFSDVVTDSDDKSSVFNEVTMDKAIIDDTLADKLKLVNNKDLLSVNSSNNNLNSELLRTEDIKSEFSHYSSRNNVRTSAGETPDTSFGVDCADNIKVEIKKEIMEEEVSGNNTMVPEDQFTTEEKDEMVELLRSVQREWLHYRPKTPPPDYETPCHMLPADDPIFTPSANTPFSMEILPLEPPSSLLDSASFLTNTFIFNDLEMNVPITDTRQSSDKNVQIGPNTLNKVSVKNSVHCNNNSNKNNSSVNNTIGVNLNDSVKLTSDTIIERTAGCSSFAIIESDVATTGSNISASLQSSSAASSWHDRIGDVNGEWSFSDVGGSTIASSAASKFNTSTLTSLKIKNNVSSDRRTRNVSSEYGQVGGNTNGILTQLGFEGTPKRTRNKLYAYSGGVGFSNASSNTLSLHTSAHTLTLNSHSANILEIPITNDPDNKLVNSQLTEGATGTTNSKKTIVRKNNFIMEVT